MRPELARLRASVTYSPMVADRIGEVLAQTAHAVMSAFDAAEPGTAERVKRRLGDPSLHNTLEGSYPCVTLLVGSELDSQTAGDRGLGRVTNSIPRFGGRFRSDLTGDFAATFGPLMEELCIAGFGAGAAYDALARAEPTTLRTRELDELIWQWVSRCIGSWSDWSNSALALAEASGSHQFERFLRIAEDAGLTKGLRKKAKREDIQKTQFMLSAAGMNLFAAHTPAADSWFART